jgi:hypothetical protein
MSISHADSGTSEERNTRRSRSAGVWVVLALMMVPLYVGSLGPVWLVTDFQLNGHLSRTRFSSRSQLVCERVYWPICRACEHSELLSNSVSSYLSLWAKLRPMMSP